ncbi:MAG: hypothetical protein K5978_01865 [Campylobacter sp.]|nr:hypothetical protein [Campylobacter sp.]
MQESYNIAFARLGHFLPFLHIICISLFMGLEVAYFLIARWLIRTYKNNEKFIYEMLTKTFAHLAIIAIISLILASFSGFLLGVSDDSIKSVDPMASAIIATKATLMLFLFINIAYMLYHHKKCVKNVKNSDDIALYEEFFIVIKYFTALNIVVSLGATYLGVAYRIF